jgi:hypothetical protein
MLIPDAKAAKKSEEEENKRIHKWWHWPQFGRFVFVYNNLMLITCTVQSIMVIARCAFEDKPNWYSIYLENYMNGVFLLDMVRNILTPYMDVEQKTMVYTFCHILFRYIRTWFLIDLFCFIPIANLRKNSEWADGSATDDWQNIKDLNFERLPKVYIAVLLP